MVRSLVWNVAAVLLLALALARLRTLVGWFFLALLFAVALEPAVRWLARRRLPRPLAVAVFLAYQQVENNFLQPLVQRRTLRMNPLAISMSLLVFGSLAGLVGVFLALPLAGVLHLVLDDVLTRRRRTRGNQMSRRVRFRRGATRLLLRSKKNRPY